MIYPLIFACGVLTSILISLKIQHTIQGKVLYTFLETIIISTVLYWNTMFVVNGEFHTYVLFSVGMAIGSAYIAQKNKTFLWLHSKSDKEKDSCSR